jgi:MFS family permease
MQSDVKKLLLTRFLRSLGQGLLAVDFALYLKDLGYSSAFIGFVFALAGLFGAFGSVLIGFISDKTSRKGFMMAYTFMLMIASFAMFVSVEKWLIVLASILGNFGQGANGSAGPFSPAEQAWLSEKVLPEDRGKIFSINSAMGFTGMSAGALLGVVPAFLKNLENYYNYRVLFLFVFVLSTITLFVLKDISEERKRKTNKSINDEKMKVEYSNLLKLVLLNSLNGFAIGLKGPLISYWFALRFGIGAEKIAPVMAFTFFVTGLLSFYTGFLTKKIGIINSVVLERSIGLVFLILLPLAPSYVVASIFYMFHQVFNRGSAGARQALAVSIVGDEERGLAVGLNAASMQLPRSAGPYVTGILLGEGQFEMPFFAAAFLQGVYLVLYKKIFSEFNFPKE